MGGSGLLQQLAIVLGIFIALLLDYVLAPFAAGGWSGGRPLALGLPAWRWMFLSMAVPAVLYGALALTIPEAPRYLISRERLVEAQRVLMRVLGEDPFDVEVAEIRLC